MIIFNDNTAYSKILAKTLFSLFTISTMGFGQILYSETYPFQNVSAKIHSERLYKLILNQELFQSIEIEKYLKAHKNIAILPVEMHYLTPIQTKHSQNFNTIELLSAKCFQHEFMSAFKDYSKKILTLQSAIKNNYSHNYIPQTEVNRYLEETVRNNIKKYNPQIQDINITIQQLSNLKNINLYNYTPEFLCSFLAVDAIIYIYIYSDIIMPIKNCFNLELLNDFNIIERELLLNLETDQKQLYISLQELKKSKFKNKKINLFTSVYDRSGELIWLHGQDYTAYDLWNNIIGHSEKSDQISSLNMLFTKILKLFPYVED